MTLFCEIATASARVASTRSRLQKSRFIVDLLRKVPEREIAAVVGWLVQEPLCGPLGVGPVHLWELSQAPAGETASVTLRDVEDTLDRVRGSSREEAHALVASLFGRLTEPERALFVGALTGSLRQGSLGGVMLLALADLSGRDETEVRRAVMVTGSIARAAEALLGPTREAVPPRSLALFRPLAPMLATSAESIEEALTGLVAPLVECKIDGVRAQVHKDGARVAVYSRQGNDITAGCAPILEALASLRADKAVLDGEVVLVGPDGSARPFQDSFSAMSAKSPIRPGDRLRVAFFDCLHRDGTDLLDDPLSMRLEALHAIASADLCVRNVHATTLDDAKRFYTEALASGHEGVMVKDLASPYRLGARGRAWQKVKEFTTVDLVVLAAEWGSGRRRGFLSNLHLGARRDDGTFCMVGKTFKGLTDAMLRWQTERLERLATERAPHIVHVLPELVVEIRFNDVQRSPRYPGGIALRFARVVRHREDKPASEVEPLDALVARLPELFAGGGPARRMRTSAERAKRKKAQLSLFER
ncbi:MAG: ATP-dependent DNA ligase [Myxococcota bacterium]|nr:ATP-dependent DNA ligase [Myxococcota bacterium]